MNDLSPQAKALLRAARSFDEPSDDDHHRVRSSVLSRVGAGAALGLAATMSTTSLAASVGTVIGGVTAKLGIAVLLAGGLSTGVYFMAHNRRVPAPMVVETSRAVPVVAAAPTAAVEVPETTASGGTEAHVRVGDSPAPQTARARDPHGSSGKGRASRSTGDIEGEVHLLEEADADLRRGDPSGALLRLAEHAAKYPGGALRQEREGMNVMALCQGGRQAEGRAAAEKFLSRSSKSALVSRIRAACGIQRPNE